MPWELDTSAVITYDTIRVESFNIANINGKNEKGPEIFVEYSLGTMVDEKFVSLDMQTAKIGKATVTSEMVTAPNGATIYDAIKKSIYSMLLSEGHIGAGVMT